MNILETFYKFLKKLSTHLPYDTIILYENMSPFKSFFFVHLSLILKGSLQSYCNRQKLETTQMTTNRWMGKQIVVYPYNGILLISKRGWTIDILNNTDDSTIQSGRNQTKNKKKERERVKIVWFQLLKILENAQ